MEPKPKSHRLSIKILGIVLGLPILVVAALTILYTATWTDPALGISSEKPTLTAASFHQLLEMTTTLEAGETALAAAGMGTHKGPFMAWLAGTTAESLPYNFLSQDPVYLWVGDQGTFMVVTDLGWKSLFGRFVPYFIPEESSSDLSRTPSSEIPFLQWTSPQGGTYFILFDRNLLAVSPSRELLETWTRRETKREGDLESTLPPLKGVRFSFSPETIRLPGQTLWISPDTEQPQADLVLDDRNAVLTLPIKPAPAFSPPAVEQKIWEILPKDTFFALSVSLKPAPLAQTTAPTLKNFPDWDWAGAETGLFYRGGSPDPIFFLRIADSELWNKVKNSLVDEKSKTIQLPPAVQDYLKLMDYTESTSSFLETGGFLFLSATNSPLNTTLFQEPENLSKTREFKYLAGRSGLTGPVNAYADLDKITPPYMESDALVFRILRLYSRSLVSLTWEEVGAHLTFRGVKGRSALIRTFTGFPKLLPQGKGSFLMTFKNLPSGTFLLGSVIPGKEVILLDPHKGEEKTWPLPENTFLAPDPSGEGLYLWDDAGNVDFRLVDGTSKPGFPLGLSGSGRVQVLPVAGGLMTLRDKLLEYHSTTSTGLSWSHRLTVPAKLLADSRLGVTALVLEGAGSPVYLVGSRGIVTQGGQKSGNLTDPYAPLLIKSGAEILVATLDSLGTLEVRDAQGDLLPDFPKTFPGKYSTPPMIMIHQDKEHLVLTDGLGNLTLIEPRTGIPAVHKTLKEITPDSKVVVQDLDRNGRQELISYGSDNQIWAWDESLQPLPDFPVMGSSEPLFLDLDRDGFLEMITGDTERRVFVYTLRF